jgi:hypothetical protein
MCPGERRALSEAPLDCPRILWLSWLDDRPVSQQLIDLTKVLRRCRVDKRDMLRSLRKPGVLVLVTRVLAQLLAQPMKPVMDANDP